MQEIFTDTFKAIRKELGLDRPRDERPLWQRCLSTESVFCQALVACGYLSESQMQRAANRYRLGRRVILFPDTDTDGSTYREWYELAQAAGDVYGQPFTVSAILEQHATPSQKQRKIDIADYLFEK